MKPPRVLSIIMGGGRGTRLSPLTSHRAKPAVPLAGKYRLVDIPISNCLNSNLNKIFVLTQFHTASLHRHIQNTYMFDPFGGGFVDILSAEQTEHTESWYQGTADAVRQNLVHFEGHDHDLVVVLSGDQLYRMDVRTIIDQHVESGAEITLAAKPFPLSKVFGLGLMRVADNLDILEFVEKPTDPEIIESLAMSEALQAKLKDPGDEKQCLASMGIYVFNKDTLAESLDNDMKDFGKEVIPALLGKAKLKTFIFDDYWEDIGTVHAFFEANLQLTDPLPPFNFYAPKLPIYTHARYLPGSKINRCEMERVIVCDGCIISDAVLERCIVGNRSTIEEGTKLKNVVMMGADYYETDEELAENRSKNIPNVGIGKNCRIENAIIDKNARIGNNVTLSPDGKPDLFEKNGVVVRDEVLIILKNTILPDGTQI
ncbi:MAG TPA: glucose-1-phosphate adenylyltransferase [Opitutales bacterium]|nr:glucose-1-phosphate adenylyltransferase [Opitutales bacterium]